MRGYRDDARPTCGSCGLAFAADDAALDEKGRPRCTACGAAATTAAMDARAEEATIAERRRRRWMIIGTLVAAVLVALLVGRLIRASREEDEKKRVELVSLTEIDARLADIRSVLDRAADADSKTCDDDRLAPIARSDGELWRGALKFRGTASWQQGDASRALRIDERSDAPAALRALREAKLLVVLLDRFDERSSGKDAWRGTLYVFDLSTSRILCWSPLRVNADEARGNISVQRLLADEARTALRKISRTLTLRE